MSFLKRVQAKYKILAKLSDADFEFTASFELGKRKYYVIYAKKYEGEIKLGFGKVEGKNRSYLSHIEWNEPSPPNSEEVESYIDEKLDKVFDAK